jgi:ribose-phosphate pyrophosphokinase
MTKPLIIALPGNRDLAAAVAAGSGAELGEIETRRFPDDETYLRLRTDPKGRSVAILCTLDRPDDKCLALLFAGRTARELGAIQVGLIAPYLAYMRQDRRFNEGEAVTSVHFADLVSSTFDWLVTVDPHLHRYSSLGEIYRIPTAALHAAPVLSDWIKANVAAPLLVGPDAESEQWVAAVARRAGAPHLVLRKERLGDRNVRITVPDLTAWPGRNVVLIDDIVSSARTMIEAARHLSAAGIPPPVCVAVHPLFAGNAYEALRQVAACIISTNTVPHETNRIDIAPLLANRIVEFL